MTPDEIADAIPPWLRPEHAPAYEAALAWLWPRCRTDEERWLAPALLLLLAPLNALVVPCRPTAGSRVNFQVTVSRDGATGPERVRLAVRAATLEHRHSGESADGGDGEKDDSQAPIPQLWLRPAAIVDCPLSSAALVLTALLTPGSD
jgi:hypothetical protein